MKIFLLSLLLLSSTSFADSSKGTIYETKSKMGLMAPTKNIFLLRLKGEISKVLNGANRNNNVEDIVIESNMKRAMLKAMLPKINEHLKNSDSLTELDDVKWKFDFEDDFKLQNEFCILLPARGELDKPYTDDLLRADHGPFFRIEKKMQMSNTQLAKCLEGLIDNIPSSKKSKINFTFIYYSKKSINNDGSNFVPETLGVKANTNSK